MESILSLALAFPILSSLFLLLNIGKAQPSLTPHGLIFESPISLSPSAFNFFHPEYTVPPTGKANAKPCRDETECAHLAALSAARSDHMTDTERSVPVSVHRSTGVGNFVAVVMGLVFVVLVAMGASYILIKRRANSRKSSPVIQPDA